LQELHHALAQIADLLLEEGAAGPGPASGGIGSSRLLQIALRRQQLLRGLLELVDALQGEQVVQVDDVALELLDLSRLVLAQPYERSVIGERAAGDGQIAGSARHAYW